MATRDEYLARTKGYKRPAINFNQRDNIRDFARSGHGQNYNRMMDIQRQLPNMDRSDPMVQEFKDRRRTLNRYGKNPMGEMLGYTPHEMMDKYVDLSRDVRQTNKPVYNKMYPITGNFMDYADKGGLWGAIASEMFGKGSKKIQKGLEKNIGDPLRAIGSDILNNVGIGGALDTSEEELRNYGNLTYPTDVHPGLSSIEGPGESEVNYSPHGPTYYDRAEGLDFEKDPNQPNVVPDDYVEEDFGAFYEDADTLAPERSMPFDDSGREDFIRRENEYVRPSPVVPGNVREDVGPLPIPEIGIEFGVDNWEEPPPFNDAGREAGIASMYGQGPQYDLGGRVYEDEFRDFTSRMGDMPGGPMTYEEFVEAYKRGVLPGLQGRR